MIRVHRTGLRFGPVFRRFTMKKFIAKYIGFSITTILVIGFIYSAAFMSVSTEQTGLVRARAEGDEDGASLAAGIDLTTEGNFAQKGDADRSVGGVWALPKSGKESPANAVQFYFTGGAAADKTFNAACFGYKESNGPALKVCELVAILGTQAMVEYPDSKQAATRFWADTITVTSFWPKSVTTGSSGAGNDIVGTVWFDTMGCRYFKWVIWNADGTTGTEAGDIIVWGSYF